MTHGLLAVFDTPDALLEAARLARAAGYRQLDAYTPFPVEGLAELLDFSAHRIGWLTLGGGLLGGGGAYLLMWWSATIAFPYEVGGRPPNSWPAFIPITFELTVLGAALASLIGMFWLNGLPALYHPIFNAPAFALASRDRFFLCIRATDPAFEPERTREFLVSLAPSAVEAVDA